MVHHEPGNGRNPWWLSAIYQLGVPTAAFLFLLWFVRTDVSRSLEQQETTLGGVEVALERVSSDTARTVMQLEQLSYLMLQICTNTARNTSERAACFKR